jgi:lysophospholipase L1-like esterase
MPASQRIAAALFFTAASACIAQGSVDFTCSAAPKNSVAKQLTASTRFTNEPHPAGWDLQAGPTSFEGNACSSARPFFFSIAAPDGNYQVTVVAGGPQASNLTIKAESRRLMALHEAIPAGGSRTFTFNVNVRTARIGIGPNAQPVKLKTREIGALDWDDKLTLEFNGDTPSIRALSIKPVNVPTIYIAGDSTVVDQDKEPWAAWGQMLPNFFTSAVSFSNQAESGETIKSFVGERRLDKIMSTIKPGDYLLIQFGHNDQKAGSGQVPAMTDFKTYLRSYIDQAKAKGASTVLVTPMNRRNFDADGHITATLGDYPQSMKDVAAERKLGLIDLNAMSKVLFETLGKEGTLHAFVHYPANTFPDQPTEFKDDTHFNAYGAYELARCIVQSISDQSLPLAKYLRPGIKPFDPAHPDPFATFNMPPSPFISVETPYGR